MKSISRTPSIYQIRHVESGRVYVGSAVNPRLRCNEHRSTLIRGVHHSRYLQRAWNKYGEDAFVFEIIEPVLFVEDLLKREQHWIDKLRATNNRHGFNLSPTAGSSLGMKINDEQSARFSEAQRRKWSDPAFFEKMSGANSVTSKRWRSMHPEGVKVVSPDGDVHVVIVQKVFCDKYNLHRGHFAGLLKGRYSVHRGWRLYKEPKE